MRKYFKFIGLILPFFTMCAEQETKKDLNLDFELTKAPTIYFKSFVDCNMAEVWVGDTFRIFPGKYGEDPLWGYSNELKYASGKNAEEVFNKKYEEFKEPSMPLNVKPNEEGLHGAVWFETVYQDKKDNSGKTLYALYHNENYPITLPLNDKTGKGYIDKNWPQGLTGPTTAAAVCRIGIMKSTNGGYSWENKGIVLEDNQERMILKPHNNSVTFAGGVGDPSAVASGDYLYIFYGEYGYPGTYDRKAYSADKEQSGQCISMARIKLADLDNPTGKAKRYDGKGFQANYDGVGSPIKNIQISKEEGGGPSSVSSSKYYWGPSVSWNHYLQAWVMLMAKSEGPSWKGTSIYMSFNKNKDLDDTNSQDWSIPKLILDKPGHVIWYPSLQPIGDANATKLKYTSLQMGEQARLFYKDQTDTAVYISEYSIRFKK
ncbi:MAG: hypothetical protein K9G06_00130 [Chitinophagaceae bacterium]|nr:hypothetical protein [Chitinophagaceae bacterium]